MSPSLVNTYFSGLGWPGEFCSVCCLLLLPQFACSIHATWTKTFSRALYMLAFLILVTKVFHQSNTMSMLRRGHPTLGAPNSDAASSVLVSESGERQIGSPIDFRVIYHGGGEEGDLFSHHHQAKEKQPRIPFAATTAFCPNSNQLDSSISHLRISPLCKAPSLPSFLIF